MKTLMPFVYDDGGRSKYFKAGKVGDCVCRAIVIASGKDYKEVYDALAAAIKCTPRNGVNTRAARFKRFMQEQGFTWTALCAFGSKESTHLYTDEFPQEGRFVCSAASHEIAVVDGVVRDIWDSRFNSWGEPRRIYGYWKFNG